MLAIAAASGRIGMAFFIGGRLVDWRISGFAARSPKAAVRYADKLIGFLKPDVVVTERPAEALHKGDKTKALVVAMAEAAAHHEVLDVAVPREQRFPSKYEEADALAERYPELLPWKPKKRRFFDNEPRNTVLFEAVALAQVVLGDDTPEST